MAQLLRAYIDLSKDPNLLPRIFIGRLTPTCIYGSMR